MLLKNALFIGALGSNDFVDNYLAPMISRPERAVITPKSFVAIMISRFRLQLTVIFLKTYKIWKMLTMSPRHYLRIIVYSKYL